MNVFTTTDERGSEGGSPKWSNGHWFRGGWWSDDELEAQLD
jgi:hypothetical protein